MSDSPVDFNEAQARYRELKSRYAAGQLSNQDFEAQVNKLLVSDAQGREWMIGIKTGKWYYAEGERWVEGAPPRAASSAPVNPPTAKGNQRVWIIGGIIAAVLIVLLLAGGGIYLFLSTQSARIANAPTPLLPVTPTRAGGSDRRGDAHFRAKPNECADRANSFAINAHRCADPDACHTAYTVFSRADECANSCDQARCVRDEHSR